MIIYLGADHRGFKIKEEVRALIESQGYEVGDLGNTEYDENDDYTDYAEKVASRVSLEYQNAKGVLICGSGNGMCIAANKFPNIRAALALTPDHAYDSRKDSDANILCLAADHIEENKIKSIVSTFLETPFEDIERRRRRLKKVSELETRLKNQSN